MNTPRERVLLAYYLRDNGLSMAMAQRFLPGVDVRQICEQLVAEGLLEPWAGDTLRITVAGATVVRRIDPFRDRQAYDYRGVPMRSAE